MKTLLMISLGLSFTFSNVTSLVYDALKGDSLTLVDTMILKIEKGERNSSNIAYKGALLMKKASFMKVPRRKIVLFKEGHQLLEEEIVNNPENVEYRFLRLVIQENAPKILKYNMNLEEDKKLVLENFSKLPTNLQEIIKEYALTSTQINF